MYHAGSAILFKKIVKPHNIACRWGLSCRTRTSLFDWFTCSPQASLFITSTGITNWLILFFNFASAIYTQLMRHLSSSNILSLSVNFFVIYRIGRLPHLHLIYSKEKNKKIHFYTNESFINLLAFLNITDFTAQNDLKSGKIGWFCMKIIFC